MNLGRLARDRPLLSTSELFTGHGIDVLHVWLKHRGIIQAPPEKPPGIRTCLAGLARVAGFRPGKRQPFPGTGKIRQAWQGYKAGIDFIEAWDNIT